MEQDNDLKNLEQLIFVLFFYPRPLQLLPLEEASTLLQENERYGKNIKVKKQYPPFWGINSKSLGVEQRL